MPEYYKDHVMEYNYIYTSCNNAVLCQMHVDMFLIYIIIIIFGGKIISGLVMQVQSEIGVKRKDENQYEGNVRILYTLSVHK